jgi:hypothetical protein
MCVGAGVWTLSSARSERGQSKIAFTSSHVGVVLHLSPLRQSVLKAAIMKPLFVALVAFLGVSLASNLPGQEKKEPAKEEVEALKTEDFPIRVG